MADFIADIQEPADAVGSTSAAELCQPVLMPNAFRVQFPGFANPGVYPDPQIQFYISMGYKMLRPERWGNMLQEGVALFAAHFLALARLAAVGGGGINGIPGTAVGVLNSGQVDKVSYGKDIASVMEEGAGHWNMTTFGMQYIRFARMMGTGPLQIGASGGFGESAYLYANGGAGAWGGPPQGSW